MVAQDAAGCEVARRTEDAVPKPSESPPPGEPDGAEQTTSPRRSRGEPLKEPPDAHDFKNVLRFCGGRVNSTTAIRHRLQGGTQ